MADADDADDDSALWSSGLLDWESGLSGSGDCGGRTRLLGAAAGVVADVRLRRWEWLNMMGSSGHWWTAMDAVGGSGGVKVGVVDSSGQVLCVVCGVWCGGQLAGRNWHACVPPSSAAFNSLLGWHTTLFANCMPGTVLLHCSCLPQLAAATP